MYARSRHSTSDFDRSMRQQEILSSLRDRLWDLWYFKDRKTILELYNIFSKYVKTDMSLSNMVSIWLDLRSWDSVETMSFNLNDSCYSWSPDCETGGFLYVPIRDYFWWASVLLTNWSDVSNLDDFSQTQKFSNLIYKNPEIYSTPQNIIIYNTTKIPLYAGSLASILRPYGFNIDEEAGTQSYTEKEFENSILYYNGIESDDSTIRALQDILKIQTQKRESPFIPGSSAKIEIFLGDDNSF